jgi:hypothetical protein
MSGRWLVEQHKAFYARDYFRNISMYYEREARENGFIEITLTRDDQSYTNQIDVDITKCNYGGERFWFLCPGCRRRVGVLYCGISDLRLLCRHCRNLAYESSNCHRSPSYETTIRHKKIADKLEAIINKKGLHIKTLLKIMPIYAYSKMSYERGMMIVKAQLTASMLRFYGNEESPEEMWEKFKKLGLVKDDK